MNPEPLRHVYLYCSSPEPALMKSPRAVLALLVALSIPLVASAELKDAGDVDVRFQATGPGGMKIKGEGDALTASEADGKLTIKVGVTKLKTGIALRDRHLRKYLETSKYPDATLVVARSALTLPEDNQEATGKATGELTLHGKTRSNAFSYKAKRTGSDYHVQGLTTIDLRDFDIEVPCYLGVCVDPEVKLKVKFKLREH